MPIPEHSTSDLVALDIGGAHLKAADCCGWSASIAFPLWQRWRELPAAIAGLVADRRPRRLVATMTGEICDCYPSRSAGVAQIVESLVAAAPGYDDPPGVYLTDGRIVSPSEAIREWRLAAASNWHALARFTASLFADRHGFLLDVGSTTTDIVPLAYGHVAALAHHDADRFLAGELVYTGVERTAVAAIVRSLPHRGLRRPVASELFAESRDAWLTLGELPEDSETCHPADGGPATAAAARIRLARTMLLDPDEFMAADATSAATAIADRQATIIARALRQVARGVGWVPDTVVIAGHGEPLAHRGLANTGWLPEVQRIAAMFSPAVARAAPAHALACIARGTIR